jgi:hypothetical protein
MATHKAKWRYVDAQCIDCGKEKQVRIDAWNRVNQQWRCLSCAAKKNFNDNPQLAEAVKKRNTTHGEAKNKHKQGHWLYGRWQKMKARCRRWPTYLAKNIKVCKEWEDNYAAFKEWAELNQANPFLELDRINNNGNYEPGNCRWITHQQNCANRG